MSCCLLEQTSYALRVCIATNRLDYLKLLALELNQEIISDTLAEHQPRFCFC